MEIREMEVIPVAHREPPLRNSWGTHSEVAARTIVRLTSADGEVGVAETYADEQVIDALERATDLVEGMNPRARRSLELRLQDPMAHGAVDTALIDLLGRSLRVVTPSSIGGRVPIDTLVDDGPPYLATPEADDQLDQVGVSSTEISSDEPDTSTEEAVTETETDEDVAVAKAEVYSAYESWTEDLGVEIVSNSWFTRRLKNYIEVEIDRRRSTVSSPTVSSASLSTQRTNLPNISRM